MTQETTNMLIALLIGGGITIYFIYKISEIAKTLKEMRDKMPDKK